MSLFNRLFSRSEMSSGRSTIRIVKPHTMEGINPVPLLRFPFRQFPPVSARYLLSGTGSNNAGRQRSYEPHQQRVSIFYNVDGVAMYLRAGDCFCRETERGIVEIAAIKCFRKLGRMGFHVEFQQKMAVQKFIISTQIEIKTLALDVFVNTYRARYS